jgi:serine/threonine-protein kinase
MAPEELTGGSASLQSDVYALGLILYEVFTARRTFDVSSAVELVRRQSAADFLRPTALVRDIDPIIERIIVRCLDPRPERRPQSVAEILSELPGRDALSAAVAAGETPSPAMVSAAAERGDLPVIAAASLLAVIVALLALFAGLTSRTMLYRLLPVLKSPEVLEEKAREIIASTGQSAPRADSDFHFYVDPDEHALLHRFQPNPRRWRARATWDRIFFSTLVGKRTLRSPPVRDRSHCGQTDLRYRR